MNPVKKLLAKPYQTIQRWIHLARPKDFGPKVFCIGYNKTGTTTLGKSMEILGYRNLSFDYWVWRTLYKKGKIEACIQYMARFDSADDLPWLKEDMIPLLDQRFPGSKFIYLTREESSWKRSLEKWAYNRTGEKVDTEKAYQAYLAHQQFVREYFSARQEDILELEIKDPKGFQKLASFLGKEAPQESFPHFNETAKMKQRG